MKHLPYELIQLIIYNKCALIIQRKWNRYFMFYHCRSPQWKYLKLRLGQYTKELSLYAGVRREWRREINDWMTIENNTIYIILQECRDGLWGHCKSSIPIIIDL